MDAEEKKYTDDLLTINMGPQHPSTHGVLRIILKLDGEKIVEAIPVIGYLHRGIEKLAESKTYHQIITLTDRLDYLSPLTNNLAYCLAAEKLLSIEIPPRAQVLRVILSEISRLQSHLIWLGTQANDIGAISPLLYTFREREELLDIIEMVGGSRMHTSYIRIGGLLADIPDGFIAKVKSFLDIFPDKIKDYEGLLTNNKIWMNRTIGVGSITAEQAINLGLCGPPIRACGIKHDLRKANPYSGYENYDFDIPTSQNGDVFSRYQVRIAEMKQSMAILYQAFDKLPEGLVNSTSPSVVPPEKDQVYSTIEGLIHQFHIMVEGFNVPKGEVYFGIEAPRGELGFYIYSEGENKPHRLKARTPSFANLQAISVMAEGEMIADMVAIIGSLDIVLGDVDK